MQKLLFSLFTLALWQSVFSIPRYDEGRVQVAGIQFLQDHADNNAYYYIPRYPRMAARSDGGFEFMFMKYVGKGSTGAGGGLFHALVEFTLPADEVSRLQDSLRLAIKNNSARIVGAVPLQQVTKNGEDGLASFQVVSSVLTNDGKSNPFTQTIITTGFAPIEGSKAAIAARLSPEGATLLWESLQGKTSDVSVMVNGYYEAYVNAYNAVLTAEVSSIYDHYSRISNYQEGFTRDQTRRITDQLVQNQILKIEAFDRTAALGVKAEEVKKILDLVTDQLVELMFDVKNGWSKTPDREAAVETDQIKGRQDKGFFSQLFSGSNNPEYVSDNQFVLKKRTDIRTNTFYLNLSQSTTVKVPVYTSGNLAGVYDVIRKNKGNANEYFRIVNLDDADFQKRDVSFMMDGGFAESFNDIFNFVSVNFRKRYSAGQQQVTGDLLFTRKNLDSTNGSLFQNVNYPRLGGGPDWLEYEYRIGWNLKGSNKTLRFPADDTAWFKSTDPGVTIMPPLQKKKVTVEVDRSAFEGDASTVVVRFLVMLGGEPTVQKTLMLRAKDPSNIHELAIFHDNNESVVYQVTRHTPAGPVQEPLKELKDDFILIGPGSTDR